MKIILDIPDQPIEEHGLSCAGWSREIAIALFHGSILGTASKIAGIHQMEFQALLSDRGICLHYDLADYQADIESLRKNNWR